MIKRLFLVSILALVLSCQAAPQGFLTIAGWSPQGEPATYDADGLWELINGAADTFLSYGFETVTVQQYSAGDVTASVAAYDMGTPLNAFGVYRAEAPVDERRRCGPRVDGTVENAAGAQIPFVPIPHYSAVGEEGVAYIIENDPSITKEDVCQGEAAETDFCQS